MSETSPYEFKDLESRWQQQWMHDAVGAARDDDARPKYYVLVEFPFTSGDGLHVGHCLSYVAQDVVARVMRMRGYNVLYPIGWDAFGLPAENYAIKHKIKPQDATKKNIATFKRQTLSLGISFDWSREIDTTDPSFYRWTQWIFLQMFKAGLAEKRSVPINWCPSCKIGLAFEEVIDGRCERCGTAVEQRTIKQWVLKITQYADRLIDDLATVDFSPEIKQQQINWIGRSEGAEIDFDVAVQKEEKYDFLFLHAFKDTSKSAFWPWLKKEVEKKGHRVTALDLPNSENPNIDEQVEYILNNYEFKKDTIIVTHSLGGVAAMKLLPKLQTQIDRLVLVSPPLKPEFLDGKERPVLQSATDWKFDFPAIKGNARSITVVADDHDHIVPRVQMHEIANKLEASFILGHGTETHFDGSIEPDVLQALFPSIRVFTTRPDTLFGATYLVLSPEHPFIHEHEARITNLQDVKKYIQASKMKSERERQENKEKTGVELVGITAVNPATMQPIPIWVADYVLTGYGTGAIMAVPAHDERDYEFAKKFDLLIQQVIAPHFIEARNPLRAEVKTTHRQTVHAIVRHSNDSKVLLLHWKEDVWGDRKPQTFIIGGIDEGEDVAAAAKREIREETGYRNVRFVKDLGLEIHTEYFAAHKNENRYAHIHVLEFVLENEDRDDVADSERKKHDAVWVEEKDALAYLNVVDGPFEWRWFTSGGHAITDDGVLINSDFLNDSSVASATSTMIAWLEERGHGRRQIQYKLHDWIFSRQHYWGEPIPIVICDSCGYVPLEDKDLPLTLPDVEYYEPTDTGESPLAAIDTWVNVTCPKCGNPAKRETDTMPNWAGSSWYYLRYCDPHNTERFADYEKLKYWLPVDLYNGGAEHTTLHLLYSRFWHKFLYDQKLVPTAEPYRVRVHHGMVLAPDGQKMSKSRGNVINPDEIIDRFGADVFRLYILFMGEYDQVKQWSDTNLQGVARFIRRFWEYATTVTIAESRSDDEWTIVQQAVSRITEDLRRRSFNTVVSHAMTCLNSLSERKTVSNDTLETFVRLLAPLIPHVTEELWNKVCGQKDSVHSAPWPDIDTSALTKASVTIGIQINGKRRGEVVITPDMSDEQVRHAVLAMPVVQKVLGGVEPTKVIYVKNRIVSIVT